MAKFMSVDGVDEVADLLKDFTPRVANNLMRTTIHSIAADISKEAKKNAPRDTGMLRRSITAKRRKSKPETPISDVIVRRDNKFKGGFYWHLVEFGTQTASEKPFMGPAREKIGAELPSRLQANFSKKLEQAVKREQKKNAKKVKQRSRR